MEAAASPAPPRRQHPRHRLGRPRGHRRSAMWSSSSRANRVGRSSSWPATTTCSTTATTAPGSSTAGRSPEDPSMSDRADVPPMQPDMSWLGVLEHHARRTPNKPIAVFGDAAVTYRGMAEWAAALAGRAPCTRSRRRRRRRAALVQQRRVPGHDLRRQPPRRDRDADQLAARRGGGAVHPRPFAGAGARVRRRRSSSWRPRRRTGSTASSCACASRPSRVDGWERFADLAAGADPVDRAPVQRRRHPPADVHVRAPRGARRAS